MQPAKSLQTSGLSSSCPFLSGSPQKGISTWCSRCKSALALWPARLCPTCAITPKPKRKFKTRPNPKEPLYGHYITTLESDFPIRTCIACGKNMKKGQTVLRWRRMHLDCFNQNPFPKNPHRVKGGKLGLLAQRELQQIVKDQCPMDEIIPQDIPEDVWGLINRVRAKNAERRGQEVEFCL